MQPEKQQTREEFIKSLFVLAKEDNFVVGDEAYDKFMSGIDKCTKNIAISYGTYGSNAIIPADFRPFYEITNDGKKILDNTKLGNETEEYARYVLKDITDKTERESGDGRKTAILLGRAILHGANKLTKLAPMDIKNSLEECLPIILDGIQDQSKDVTLEDIQNIATISSENKIIGENIRKIYEKIGVDGVIEIDNSNLPDTFFEITEGVRLKRCGFMYPYMANSNKERAAEYKNPKIVLIKEKLTDPRQLDGLFKGCASNGINELVLFVDDIDLTVSQSLAILHNGLPKKDGTTISIKSLVIKAPTIYKDVLFEDFAKITGATIIDPAVGTSLKSFSNSWFGTCEKISTTKDETIILGIKDISDHIKVLEERGTDLDKNRLFWLRTKTAILKLGANSDTELSHLRSKASDARNAAYLALSGGSVVGGGISFINIIPKLPETVGGNILKEALTAPLKQIMKNANIEESEIKELLNSKANEMTPEVFGFNSKTLKCGDLRKEGVIDPTIVVKNSITNALSVASTALTTRLIFKRAQ